jgi:hypothetical protein
MTDDQKPIPWYQSSQIRAALGLIIPGAVSMAHLLHVDKKLGVDLDEVSADTVMGVVTFAGYVLTLVVGPVLASVFWIFKRVKAGLDVNSTAPEIVPPKAVRATVDAVKRLTNS